MLFLWFHAVIIKLTAANVVFTTRYSTPTLSQTHTSLYIHGCDDLVARGVHRESQRPSVSFGVESHQSWHRNDSRDRRKMTVVSCYDARKWSVKAPFWQHHFMTENCSVIRHLMLSKHFCQMHQNTDNINQVSHCFFQGLCVF